MPIIKIRVDGKYAQSTTEKIVCGNSDYEVEFSFSSEWEEHDLKTARFLFAGQMVDKPFTGNVVPIPIVKNAYFLEVGVFAGDLRTTTPALVPCIKSILCSGGTPVAPEEDVYLQLIKMIEDGRIQGKPGITPHIGENGNWWIGEEDTGIGAEGKDGDNYILTKEDMNQITKNVLSALPQWEGGSF